MEKFLVKYFKYTTQLFVFHYNVFIATATIPTIHWAENELYPSASLPKSITSTLKDYRPPPKTMISGENSNLEKIPRLASTIFRCQICTKAFVSQELLQNHIKIHADTISVTQSVTKTENSVVTENKILPDKLVSVPQYLLR